MQDKDNLYHQEESTKWDTMGIVLVLVWVIIALILVWATRYYK